MSRRQLLRLSVVALVAALMSSLLLLPGWERTAGAYPGETITQGGAFYGPPTGLIFSPDDGVQHALRGQASTGTGLYGISNSGYGVVGHAPGTQTGSAPPTGVFGTSATGYGVWAQSLGGAPALFAKAHGANAVGAYVESTQPSGYALLANANAGGVAMYGVSGGSHGIWGQIFGGNGYAGIFESTAPGVKRAGYFGGDVLVTGSLTVQGMKSAAVAAEDGTLQRVYSLEAPESYFEDFGSAQVVSGRVQVALDPAFAALVRTSSYYVFLTPEGDSNGLYVTNKTPTGFEIREQRGGASSLAVAYRIVAQRADVTAPRLAPVTADAVASPGGIGRPPPPLPPSPVPPALPTLLPTPSSAAQPPRTPTPVASAVVTPTVTATLAAAR